MRAETISRRVRRRSYYSIEDAGALVGLGRTMAYHAAKQGLIPTERDGRLLLVPRASWDRKAKRLLRGNAK